MAEPDAPDAPTSGTPCPSCGFLNPPNRLYCSDCGAKLEIPPPSYVGAEPSTDVPVTPGKIERTVPRKKPRILSSQPHNPVLDYAKIALRALILGAAIALLVQLLRPPANLPPPATKFDPKTVADVRARMAEVAKLGSYMTPTWPQLNAYLAAALVPAEGGWLSGSFVSASVQPCPGGFTLATEKTVTGVSIHSAVDYKLVVLGGSLALQPTGARIGQVPMPLWAVPLAQKVSGDVAGALQTELQTLRAVKTVRLSPSDVRIQFGASRR